MAKDIFYSNKKIVSNVFRDNFCLYPSKNNPFLVIDRDIPKFANGKSISLVDRVMFEYINEFYNLNYRTNEYTLKFIIEDYPKVFSIKNGKKYLCIKEEEVVCNSLGFQMYKPLAKGTLKSMQINEKEFSYPLTPESINRVFGLNHSGYYVKTDSNLYSVKEWIPHEPDLKIIILTSFIIDNVDPEGFYPIGESWDELYLSLIDQLYIQFVEKQNPTGFITKSFYDERFKLSKTLINERVLFYFKDEHYENLYQFMVGTFRKFHKIETNSKSKHIISKINMFIDRIHNRISEKQIFTK